MSSNIKLKPGDIIEEEACPNADDVKGEAFKVTWLVLYEIFDCYGQGYHGWKLYLLSSNSPETYRSGNYIDEVGDWDLNHNQAIKWTKRYEF